MIFVPIVVGNFIFVLCFLKQWGKILLPSEIQLSIGVSLVSASKISEGMYDALITKVVIHLTKWNDDVFHRFNCLMEAQPTSYGRLVKSGAWHIGHLERNFFPCPMTPY